MELLSGRPLGCGVWSHSHRCMRLPRCLLRRMNVRWVGGSARRLIGGLFGSPITAPPAAQPQQHMVRPRVLPQLP